MMGPPRFELGSIAPKATSIGQASPRARVLRSNTRQDENRRVSSVPRNGYVSVGLRLKRANSLAVQRGEVPLSAPSVRQTFNAQAVCSIFSLDALLRYNDFADITETRRDGTALGVNYLPLNTG